jgi:predicted ATPase/DNA-binding CsgD family transcriptional regulator
MMVANNLPLQPTSFVGREKELTEIAALLADPNCRLLTLVGAGGIGKTRLALQAAADQLPRFADGVSFVALDGLSYPIESSVGSQENYSAVQLFDQRARQINNHFSLDENILAVQSICRYVEGMPLGLELAASWLRIMSCQQIADQIASNLNRLTTPLRNIPERHRSLRAVFTQSWNLLSKNEQSILMKLSVFRGGFDLEATEQIASASLSDLAALADKSLIRLNAAGRYDLHELLRQFAADQLLDAGLADATIQQHIAYFLNFAEQAEAHEFGREQIAWFDKLEVEFDNIRAALSRSTESETGLRFAAALGWFFSERSHWNEGLAWLEQMLTANPNAPISLRAKALHTAGAIAGILGDHPRSEALSGEALALAKATNDRWNIAWALSHLAIFPQTNPAEYSTALLHESLALFRELENPMGITHTLVRLAWSAFKLQNYAYMRQLLDEASIYAHQVGDQSSIGWITYTTSWLYRKDGNLEQTKIYLERSILHFRAARFMGSNNALMMLADIELELGNIAQAKTRNKEALITFRDTAPNHHYLPGVLIQLACVATASGALKQAVTLLGAANSIIVDAKYDPAFYPPLEDTLVSLRTNLGEKTFAEAWAVGYAMTRAQAIAYALEDYTVTTIDLPLSELSDHTLTDRELQILHLIADGLNSREVAEQLYLSVGTIRWYLKTIYSKLDAHSRSEALARAKALKLFT